MVVVIDIIDDKNVVNDNTEKLINVIEVKVIDGINISDIKSLKMDKIVVFYIVLRDKEEDVM